MAAGGTGGKSCLPRGWGGAGGWDVTAVKSRELCVHANAGRGGTSFPGGFQEDPKAAGLRAGPLAAGSSAVVNRCGAASAWSEERFGQAVV